MFPYQRDGRATIVPVADERIPSKIIQRVQSQFITLLIKGTLTIAGGAADALLNRGSILAAFKEIGFNADGEDKHLYDGRVLRFIAEMAAPSALSAKRVTSTAAAAYALEEQVRIYFAHPFAAIPRETAFMERDSETEMFVFAKMHSTPGLKLAAVSGGVTAVLSAVTIEVAHEYDQFEKARPLFIPYVRQIVEDVNGANTQKEIFLKTSNAIRALVLSQDTTGKGEQNDIINKVALKGDFGDIIGPNQVAFNNLVLDSEFEFGGAVVSSNRAHFGWNAQRHGRLAMLLTKAQAANLRWVLDCQPSVVAGAGTSQVRTTIVELIRDPAVVSPELSIPV